MRKIKRLSNSDWDKFRSLEGMVRMVLISVWDPIGVFGHSEALDEYDNYVLVIVGLLISDATVDVLQAHLTSLATEYMGMHLSERLCQRTKNAAEILAEMYSNYD